MGLFKKKTLPDELRNIRLKPSPLGTKVFMTYVNAVANEDFKQRDTLEWMKHNERMEQGSFVDVLDDGIYKIMEVKENKVGIFYKIQPEDRNDKNGAWVLKSNISVL